MYSLQLKLRKKGGKYQLGLRVSAEKFCNEKQKQSIIIITFFKIMQVSCQILQTKLHKIIIKNKSHKYSKLIISWLFYSLAETAVTRFSSQASSH